MLVYIPGCLVYLQQVVAEVTFIVVDDEFRPELTRSRPGYPDVKAVVMWL